MGEQLELLISLCEGCYRFLSTWYIIYYTAWLISHQLQGNNDCMSRWQRKKTNLIKWKSNRVYFTPLGRSISKTRNVGQCPTWWPPCRIWVAPFVQRRKVWLTSTTRVPRSNAANMRNPLKFAAVPQTGKPISQPLVGWSSPYYQDMWRRYCCFTSFSHCRYMP